MDKNKIINQYYDEFKVFIKENKMPLIIPVEKSSENNNMDEFAFIEKDFIRGIAVPIIYNKSLFNYNENFVKSIFFHEFTHIYDAIKLRNNPNYNDIMCTYSEIHASYVMMQKLTDFRESLSFNSKICIENTTTTIKKYFEHQLKMIIENNRLFPNDINILLDRILRLTYFIGEFIFVNSIDQRIVFNIDSPYKDEVFDMIENYPNNPNGIAEAYLNILEKYKQHRRIVLANDFSKMINGAFSPEELIKKTENI